MNYWNRAKRIVLDDYDFDDLEDRNAEARKHLTDLLGVYDGFNAAGARMNFQADLRLEEIVLDDIDDLIIQTFNDLQEYEHDEA